MSGDGAKVVLAIDPGSAKAGMAIVSREEDGAVRLGWHGVVPADQVAERTREAMERTPIRMVIVGSGTSSKAVVHALRQEFPAIGILLVDERDTTLHARERYWEHNPRRGWRRLWPASMQVPPESYDDFAALVIAERVLHSP